MFSLKLKYIFICLLQTQVWAIDNLEPLSAEGFQLISPFIRYQEDTISFAEGVEWPTACDGVNNRIESSLGSRGIKNYQLMVSTQCNFLIKQLLNKNAAKNIELLPLRVSNPLALKFDRGEIPSFPLSYNKSDNSDSIDSKIACESKIQKFEKQIQVVAAKMAADTSLIPVRSSDGKIYYLKITSSKDVEVNKLIQAELAKPFNSKLSQSARGSESSSMLGLSSEVALNMSAATNKEVAVCRSEQQQGTVVSQYCHALLTNGVRVFLENEAGVNSSLAHVLGSSLYIPKELLNDRKPELGDIGVVNVNIFNEAGKQVNQKVLGTVFGDGSFYLVWQKDLK